MWKWCGMVDTFSMTTTAQQVRLCVGHSHDDDDDDDDEMMMMRTASRRRRKAHNVSRQIK